ncbi:Phage gp6-like head-tail connector protein [Desulfotomaculum arcticum]|uniref:Phage gp6-like head-tail connector protein n=1 Tax=Desulfotruncus arcticus DSM 17038 TaxID=1121424 RepID=A0A1I2VSZ2_9FIRM|nr:phage head-tail connector protein [Desulfotruncus arcticus]SFG92384.1 Phage gp6-like head-tail connector protein [Desulfotomaculum arcticum] [Desulfotruncus arcticus DSM 17038]
MLETVKMLLGIDEFEIALDGILNHFINQAYRLAYAYCNLTELPADYDDTIADLAVYLYNNRDSVGYKQKVQGERSVTYEGDGIPEYIKTALPLPKIKVGCQ